ncbi:MAG: rhodanese-like domain-containing protein [Bacteroidales bacterium]|nr:rhodanese-like domain-containing protein [Bacteroidales bacterium]
MNTLKQLSISLILLAFVLLILPGSGKYSFTEKPADLTLSLFSEEIYISVDQVARYVVSEDSSIQLIDLRDIEEYQELNIPGAMNIPLWEFFERRPETFLFNKSIKYIFYSNSNTKSAYALSLALGLGYKNCYIMEGGLNRWFETIMYSSFTGKSISPRENALFENRSKAKRFFTEINSLPDSLKLLYAESRRQAEQSLDGGCE